ncbi:coronatine-insensitive protein 1-like [Silene latifolia]|uniref:coronatine-insensitive protein 1-like n=1 Tax=Silene latifolia TaxID=37657 RepID=UPI003D788A82
MTNETLARIGENLKDLNDFRLVMWKRKCADLPLDDGVRSLLQGYTNLTRFAFQLKPGGLTDIGLRYIGQYGQKLKSMIFGGLGETDTALITFSTGCPSLKKLEIKDCSFTGHGLAIAASQLASLRGCLVHYGKIKFLGS